MTFRWCIQRRFILTIAVLGLFALLAGFPARSSAGPSLGSLNQELSQEQAHQQQLRSSLGQLAGLISSLNSQIALVESREAAVRAQLAHDRQVLAATKVELQRQRHLVAVLKARLARALMILSRQLVSNYESGSPDLMAVVLESNGFTDLLDRIKFLSDAEHQQQQIITIARIDKARADAAVKRLAALEKQQQQATQAAIVEARALAGMNALLHSKQAVEEQAQAVQQAALSASQSRAGAIQGEIAQIEAQQAAARAAAQQAAEQAAQQAAAQAGSSGAAPAASGGWVIPSPIVNCESGGQNLPPNSAGASGYYQILPSTWSLYGGSGPAAYMASRAEQDAVASRIWGGQGPGAWVCAGIVGIH
jgi:peptidoglycan hydrolase CwlO-like protein